MPTVFPVPELPAAGSRADLARPGGSADALFLAELARTSRPRPLVVLTPDPQDAQRLAEECAWFAPGLRVMQLPDWETLPYDQLSPHQDLVSERLASLYAVSRGEFDLLLVPATTALYRLAPPSYLAAHTFFLKRGDRLDAEKLRAQLALAGYSHVTQVVSPGEFSVRGSLIDLFPMGTALPLRIDLFDDEIDSLRTFDVDTQRTVYPVDEIRLLPAREFPIDEKGRTRFRQRFRELFPDATKSAVYKDISSGALPAGIEYYLPLFFESTAALFDYLPAATTLVTAGGIDGAVDQFWRDTKNRFDVMRGDTTRPLLPPSDLFLSSEQFFIALRRFGRIELRAGEAAGPTAALPDIACERKAARPLGRFSDWLDGAGRRVLVLADAPGRRETMAELFAEHGLKPAPCADWQAFCTAEQPFMLGVGPLASGFMVPAAGIAVFTEAEFYRGAARSRTRGRDNRRATMEGFLRDLSELRVGDPVVHVQHGIGRYQGLVNLDLGEGTTEFLHLEYAGDTKLYVPVTQLALISRYGGVQPEAVVLSTLGSGQWDRAKRRAAEQAHDTAAELLALYAQREARAGHAFNFSSHDLDAFAEGFGFEETPDQLAAIAAVQADMKSGRPMDRLVCGDVGFGKTEVALRAAFIAVSDGRQVAILAPTTLLAEQHFQTFSDRFADWPVRVAELSRFRSAKEISAALKDAADGKIDIVIGTHRLLQKDVRFKRLGLVIIDEEHRFGVRHKEALKQLRAEVDVLTLTATPIPRTLGMSLEGLREISVIATAPSRRLAIRTFVSPWSRGLIREACLREFKRGGQVYFLHNEVESIGRMHEALAELLPEARIAIGHGQLPERELERVMRDFTHQRSNLLLCSTIIETGIDIPSANTIVINRADKFGLAQLHQLRGRVGRSHHQAYAYLLTDQHAKPTEQARRRLDAIQAMEELGSGFYLAMHDLEIRGAGEVLGESQSGEMHEVGFALYADMLKAAVSALRKGKQVDLTQPLEITSDIKLHASALLPADYCNDIHERLTLYKRLASCATREELDAMREELIDRFGPLPDPARVLLDTHRLRIAAQPLGVARIDASEQQILLQFVPQPPLDPANIIRLVQSDRNLRLAGQDKLAWKRTSGDAAARAAAAQELLQKLQSPRPN
ncbi:MAG: transcription-repair coupling factor [Rhodocyclaceae bacterium]|nr:transcription-repair coupling factor [Rhodocyclaceae bacterium]MBX3668353.1 transcription-repair coupling factor [Rhodocyclaceae bacterium]